MYLRQPYLRALLICSAMFVISSTTNAQPPGTLLIKGQPSTEASLKSITTDGTLSFHIGEEVRSFADSKFIRWSNPTVDLKNSELIYIDGSRLVIDQSWTGQSSLSIEDDNITFETKHFGKQSVARSEAQGVLLNPPADLLRKTKLLDKLINNNSPDDRLILTSGDILVGQVLKTMIQKTANAISFQMQNTKVDINSKRVAAIVFGKEHKTDMPKNYAVGLKDGSQLIVQNIIVDQDQYQATLASNVQLAGTSYSDIVSLQSLNKISYLSDIDPIDYQHQPYLSIPWTYRHNRNLQGGPLRVAGETYLKGIAMHSHSQLTYEIPQHKFKHFVSTIAIDDLSEGSGSVIFKVLLRVNDEWNIAFTSPLIRGRDQPLTVKVALDSADQIALVTEYADRGDQLDHANWLDPRFE